MRRHVLFKFRTYIAGGALNCAQAPADLGALCRAHLPDRHEIEVVDVFWEPKCTPTDGIFLAPAFVKIALQRAAHLVGTFSQTRPVLRALRLQT